MNRGPGYPSWLGMLAMLGVILATASVHADSTGMRGPQLGAIASVPLQGDVPRLVWESPETLILVNDWHQGGAGRAISGSAEVQISNGQVLFVPVDRGAWVQAAADSASAPIRLGLADGREAVPDTIVWQSTNTTTLRVPAWSSASHVAIRSQGNARLSVTISAPTVEPLEWFLLDQRVADWIASDRRVPEIPHPDAQRILAALTSLRSALTDTNRPLAAPQLLGLWWTSSLRMRPLTMPFFVPVDLGSVGERRVVQAPARIAIRGAHADVHRWQLQGVGPARVVIRENGTVARVVQFKANPAAKRQWSIVEKLRTVPSAASTDLELEVTEGVIAFSLQGYSARSSYRELFGSAKHRQANAAQELVLTETQSLYRESLRAKSPSAAIEAAIAGLAGATDSAWRAMFVRRLLDLAVLDDQLSTRAGYFEKLAASRAHAEPRSSQAPPRLNDAAFEAFLESLQPPREGHRPTWGESLELLAQAQPTDALDQRLAADYWKAFPYRSLSPKPGSPTSAALQPLPNLGWCSPAIEGIEAWLIPDRDRTELRLALPPQVYAVATLRPLNELPEPEGQLVIDELPVTVHAAAGLGSRVALATGTHWLTRLPDTPRFALEMTEGMVAPCSNLYRWQRWAALAPTSTLEFSLPSPGASSVIRLLVPAANGPAQFVASLGTQRFEIVTRPPATGTVELPVAADDELLALTANTTVSVAASMRRELSPLAPTAEVPLAALQGTSAATSPRVATPLSPAMLHQLSSIGRNLREPRAPNEQSRLRKERAELLVRASFPSLAMRDVESVPVPETGADLLRIEGATEKAFRVGVPSGLGPQPLPFDARGLIERRRGWQQFGAVGCALDLDHLGTTAANAETLLAAFCAEKSGLPAAAAALYERLARSSTDGRLLLHAATLLADSAAAAENKDLGLKAALLEAQSMAWGAETNGLRSRLADALHFVTPMPLDGSIGTHWLARGLPAAPSPRQQVLSHLLDAPKDALLVESDEAAELLVNPTATADISVSSGCDSAFFGQGCRLQIWIDGSVTDCSKATQSRLCLLRLAAGKHRIRLAFPDPGAVGWVRASLGGQPLEPMLVSQWAVVEGGGAAKVGLRGPTVLSLRARSLGSGGGSVSVQGCGLETNRWSFDIPADVDPEARTWPTGVKGNFGQEFVRSIPIELDQVCELNVSASKSTLLLRLSFARADAPPKPRPVATQSRNGDNAGNDRSPRGVAPLAAEVRPRALSALYPFLVGARLRFVSESLAALSQTDSSSSEGAFQDVFGEVSANLERELVRNRWWGSLSAGARLRHGPTTEFARVALDMPPQVGRLGVDLIASAYSQSFDASRTTTYSTTGRISTIYRFNPNLAILPQVGFTTLHVGTAPTSTSNVDGDVYSNFYASHPRYASGSATLATRPYVDAILNLSLSTRTLPSLDGIDRASATVELLGIPVADWPLLIGADWMSSYRPSSSLRPNLFVRHDFGIAWGLWHWLTPSERIRWFGRIDLFFDAPASSLGNLIIAPTIGLEITSSGTRGLRDLSPQQAPFKEFQERGSGRIRTGRTGELESALPEGIGP